MSNSRHPKQFRAYLVMTFYTFLAMIRNPATVAFGFLFPIVFISVFGLVGGGEQSIKLGLPSNVDSSNVVVTSLKNIKAVSLDSSSLEDLNKKLIQGKLDAIMSLGKSSDGGTQVKLTTTTGNPSGAAAATSLVQGVADQISLQSAGVTKPIVTVSQQEISGRKFRYIDFALPGQIGFSLLSTAIFGTVFGFIALKRGLVLKRMFATPVRALTILLAQGTSRLVMALLQTALILGIGVFALGFYLPHGVQTLAELFLLSTIGLVAFMGFGLFLSGFASDENSAGPLVNLVTLPQFLLSGVFFSTDNFPAWIQPIANNLPLSYFNQAVRKVTTEGGTLLDTAPYLLGLAVWSLAMYLLASRTFKWE